METKNSPKFKITIGKKLEFCLENGLELLIIDTSDLTYFKVNKAQKYLQTVTQVIDKKLANLKI